MKQKLFGKPYFLLLLVVILGLLLRLIFFSGMGISDSLVYSKTAHDINEGRGINPNSTLTLSTRLGLVLPTAFSYVLFGINDFSSVIFVLVTSIAAIVLMFYFGKLLFNEKIGFIAAFLLSFFPLDVVYATKLVSDFPSAFFMSLGVYIFLYSEMKHKMKYGLGYIASGILIGIGYMIRESALLIAMFFISYIIYKKRIKGEYLLVPLGVLIIFTIEAFIFFSLTNDPFYRIVASQQYNAKAVIEEYNYFGRLDFPIGIFHYPWLFLTNNLLAYFYIPSFIAMIYSLIKRKREAYIMLIWLIPLLLYLSFGSASFTQYIPLRAVERYTSIVTVPMLLLLAFFLSEKNIDMKRWVMPILAFLLLVSIGTVYVREDRHLLDNLREASPFLKNLDKAVFIDDRSLSAINYISEYADNENLEKYPGSLDKVKDSYIVINRHMIRNLKEANKNLAFPDEIENIPKEWKIINKIGDIEKDKIIVYYAP